MRARHCILLTVLLVTWMASSGYAQWVAAPYLGINISGDVEKRKGGPGGSITYFGDLLGFEFDFQRYQHFFKDADLIDLVPDPRTDFDTDAVSFMGNVVAPIHVRGATKWRPYGTVGFGVIRSWLDSTDDHLDAHQQNPAVSVGGGVTYWLTRRIGVRGDLRYFRAIVDEGEREGVFFRDYGFWRITLGVTVGSATNPRRGKTPGAIRKRVTDPVGELRAAGAKKPGGNIVQDPSQAPQYP